MKGISKPDGCSITHAADGLGYKTSTLKAIVDKNAIKTSHDPLNKDQRLISQDDLIGLAVNKYGWVEVSLVCQKTDSSFPSFSRHARDGKFGECIQNLSGLWCIRSERLLNLPEIKRLHEKANKDNLHYERDTTAHLKKGEMTIEQIAELIGDVHRGTIQGWIKNELKTKRGLRGSYVIKKRDLIAFAKKVVAREIRVWESTRQQLEQLLKQLRSKIAPRWRYFG